MLADNNKMAGTAQKFELGKCLAANLSKQKLPSPEEMKMPRPEVAAKLKFRWRVTESLLLKGKVREALVTPEQKRDKILAKVQRVRRMRAIQLRQRREELAGSQIPGNDSDEDPNCDQDHDGTPEGKPAAAE